MVMTREGPVASNARHKRSSVSPLSTKVAAVGLAAMMALGVVLAIRSLSGPGGPSPTDAIAASETYPVTERDSVAGCLDNGRSVGPCILAERTMRSEGAPLWRDASVGTRRTCYDSIQRYAEPGARLYACLLAASPPTKG